MKTKIIYNGKDKNTEVLLEYEDSSYVNPDSFADLKGMQQLVFMPRLGMEKAFEFKFPYITYYTKNIKNQVMIFDGNQVPVIYQSN